MQVAHVQRASIDVSIDACVAMRMVMYIDVGMGMRADMDIGMRAGVHVDMGIELLRDTCAARSLDMAIRV